MSRLDEVFRKVDTVCCVCGTPLTSPNDRHLGDKYYCLDDYERELEKPINRIKKRENKKAQKFFRSI